MNTGQFIGGCVEDVVWIGVGAYVAWFWPRRVRRDVRLQKISEQRALAKLKKFNPRLGYLIIIYGFVRLAMEVSEYL
jgi:hypothetical protein